MKAERLTLSQEFERAFDLTNIKDEDITIASKYWATKEEFFYDRSLEDVLEFTHKILDLSNIYTYGNSGIHEEGHKQFLNFTFSDITSQLLNILSSNVDQLSISSIAYSLHTLETFNAFNSAKSHDKLNTLQSALGSRIRTEENLKSLDLALFIRSFNTSHNLPKDFQQDLEIILSKTEEKLTNNNLSLIQKIYCVFGLAKINIEHDLLNAKISDLANLLVSKINMEFENQSKSSHLMKVHKHLIRSLPHTVLQMFSDKVKKKLGDISPDISEISTRPTDSKSFSNVKAALTRFHDIFTKKSNNNSDKYSIHATSYLNYSFLFRYVGEAFKTFTNPRLQKNFIAHFRSTYLKAIEGRLEHFVSNWDLTTISSHMHLLQVLNINPNTTQRITSAFYEQTIKLIANTPFIKLESLYSVLINFHNVTIDNRLNDLVAKKTLQTLILTTTTFEDCIDLLSDSLPMYNSTTKQDVRQKVETGFKIIISKINHIFTDDKEKISDSIKFSAAKAIVLLPESLRKIINLRILNELGIASTADILPKPFWQQARNIHLIKISTETANSIIHPLQRDSVKQHFKTYMKDLPEKNKEMFLEFNLNPSIGTRLYLSDSSNRGNCALITT